MREIGMRVDPELIFEGDHTMEGGIRALKHLAKLPSRPTAIMCSNDMTAIGVMREAYDFEPIKKRPTGEQANGRTGKQANGRTGKQANGRTRKRANGRTATIRTAVKRKVAKKAAKKPRKR